MNRNISEKKSTVWRLHRRGVSPTAYYKNYKDTVIENVRYSCQNTPNRKLENSP